MDKVMNWRKASYSSTNGGACVIAGNTRRHVVVGDTKNPDGPTLGFTPEQWRAFTRSIKTR